MGGIASSSLRQVSSRASAVVSVLTLGLISLSFLLPKMLVLDFFRSMWVQIPIRALPDVLREDLFLAFAVFLVLRLLRPTRSPLRALAMGSISTLLFLLLLFDARVRELWLHPIDWPLLAYAWKFRSDITSGLPLFFNFASGWHMTFRRALVFLVAGHIALWSVVLILAWRGRGRLPAPSRGRRWLWPVIAAASCLAGAVLVSRVGHSYRYRLHCNLISSLLTQPFRSTPPQQEADRIALSFDQPARRFRHDETGPRQFLSEVKPFQRLVIVFLESIRWREMEASDADSLLPNLRRLANEGMLARAYAPIPHSSKAYFAVLTGRYAYPGIEMRESIAAQNDSFLHSLRKRLHARSYSFSSMCYAFENMGGLLGTLGIEDRVGAVSQSRDSKGSSFGADDAPLYETAADILAADNGPFIALLFPIAAHFPYEYPDKPEGKGSGHDAYCKSVAHADYLLGKMIEQFRARQLDRDTLFVFLGDHGESFNEHGLLAHNSSLFDEEVTVPLVFWASDGRLRHEGILHASELDVAPTVLDLFGIEQDETSVQGTSLLRQNHRPWIYLSTFFDDLGFGLVEYPNKYIFDPATGKLLQFHLELDPLERTPLPVAEHSASIVSRIQAFRQHTKRQFKE